jgi:hypothetical protein
MQQHLNGTIVVAEDHGIAWGRQLVLDSLANDNMKVLIIEHPPYPKTFVDAHRGLFARQIENPELCTEIFSHAQSAHESTITLKQLVLNALVHKKKVYAADLLAYNGFNRSKPEELAKRDAEAARLIKDVIRDEGQAGVVILWGRNHFYPEEEWGDLENILLHAKLRQNNDDGPPVDFHLIDGLTKE